MWRYSKRNPERGRKTQVLNYFISHGFRLILLPLFSYFIVFISHFNLYNYSIMCSLTYLCTHFLVLFIVFSWSLFKPPNKPFLFLNISFVLYWRIFVYKCIILSLDEYKHWCSSLHNHLWLSRAFQIHLKGFPWGIHVVTFNMKVLLSFVIDTDFDTGNESSPSHVPAFEKSGGSTVSIRCVFSSWRESLISSTHDHQQTFQPASNFGVVLKLNFDNQVQKMLRSCSESIFNLCLTQCLCIHASTSFHLSDCHPLHLLFSRVFIWLQSSCLTFSRHEGKNTLPQFYQPFTHFHCLQNKVLMCDCPWGLVADFLIIWMAIFSVY